MKLKYYWKRFCQMAITEVDSKNRIYILVYFAIISLLEMIAYIKKGIFSVVASRIWLLTALILFSTFLCYVVMMLYYDIRNKHIVSFVGFLSMFVFLFSFIGNVEYSDINADAAQQLSAGLYSFSVADWNYTEEAFLGYANRQYLLGAIPAIFFGRSIFTLHLGFAVLFLLGWTMLYFEFRVWLKNYGVNETIALIPCYSILVFQFITEYYLNFEQAITPVALTMIGIALYMRLCRRIDVITMISLTWVGCFYCDSYTPVVASLGLLFCFLGLYVIHLYLIYRKSKIVGKSYKLLFEIQVLLGSMVTIASFFIATLIGNRKDRLSSVRKDIDLISYTWEAWRDFFSDKYVVFFGVFLGIILLYLFLALTLHLQKYDFIIAIWVLGVVVFANILEGYTTYDKAWILQRTMIIIPVLVTAIFLCIIQFVVRYHISIKQKDVIIVILFLGVFVVSNFRREHQSFCYFRYIQPMKYMIACAEEVIDNKSEREINIVVITDNLLQSNIYDYATFFYPSAYTCSVMSNDTMPEMDRNRDTFVFSESKEALVRCNIDVQSKIFENPRYNTVHTWYYGEIE